MKLIERSAQTAQEASADGINWTFSPMVDVSRDPRWEEFLKVLVMCLFRKPNCKSNGKGYQQDDLSKNNSILSP
jgi:beta-glucosidase